MVVSGEKRATRTPVDIAFEVDEGVPLESLRALLLKLEDAAANLPTAAPTSGLEAYRFPPIGKPRRHL